MSDELFPEINKPLFDKDYCDNNDIQAEWFSFDRTLATLLEALVNEHIDDNGVWALSDYHYLAYAIYAIIQYQLKGTIPDGLIKKLKAPEMKLANLAVNQAIEKIEDSRKRIAINRYNGSKGGNARSRK